jgi:hypothetical protein
MSRDSSIAFEADRTLRFGITAHRLPYLIDGNNVAHAWKRVTSGGPAGLGVTASERAEVIRQVADVLRRIGARGALVFDGGETAGSDLGVLSVHGAPDADAWILTRLRTERRGATNWIVVTADKALRERCRALGAQVVRPDQFRKKAGREKPRDQPEDDERTSDLSLHAMSVQDWLRYFENR